MWWNQMEYDPNEFKEIQKKYSNKQLIIARWILAILQLLIFIAFVLGLIFIIKWLIINIFF